MFINLDLELWKKRHEVISAEVESHEVSQDLAIGNRRTIAGI